MYIIDNHINVTKIRYRRIAHGECRLTWFSGIYVLLGKFVQLAWNETNYLYYEISLSIGRVWLIFTGKWTNARV